MPMLSLEIDSATPLIEQITSAIKKMIDDRGLRAGVGMPSIRKFAQEHGISRFTVVQAYDRLVAMGYLQSRKGSGFYVAPRPRTETSMDSTCQPDSAVDVVWLLRKSLEDRSSKTMPGAWWLPASWMEETGIRKSMRTLALKSGEFLTAYGTPSGYLPLRELLQSKLAGIGIAADTSQIILTAGVTHAMDLVTRHLVRAGDAVLVDDPGYFILFGGLKSFGAKVIGVPWNQDGPDTHAMEALIREHKPKVFFTNTILHNPTGASISQPVAYRVLQLAEKYDLTLVEDDIYGDFHPAAATRLATLDQLNRVIYVSSFSKSVSASLRVGYFACSREMAANLCDVKLLTGLTTSEVSERLMYQLLTDGHYRKHLDKLRAKLTQARQRTIVKLEKLGFTIHCEPEGGMFIWAKPGDSANSAEMAIAAAKTGIMLAPGNMFRPNQEASPWLRFNVAHCDDEATFEFFSG
ncbi:MAG: aminotransferase class I/II-fold pyridoxal phosphate-dependent enzyme [Sideroxydans sp.]|nr:aminotransferase class I/II-fold pyridoxal phosphate-dependent enzyme [Sideroxydans sp.]